MLHRNKIWNKNQEQRHTEEILPGEVKSINQPMNKSLLYPGGKNLQPGAISHENKSEKHNNCQLCNTLQLRQDEHKHILTNITTLKKKDERRILPQTRLSRMYIFHSQKHLYSPVWREFNRLKASHQNKGWFHPFSPAGTLNKEWSGLPKKNMLSINAKQLNVTGHFDNTVKFLLDRLKFPLTSVPCERTKRFQWDCDSQQSQSHSQSLCFLANKFRT